MNKGRKKIFMTLWMAMIMLTMGAWAEDGKIVIDDERGMIGGLMTDGLIAPLSEEVTNVAPMSAATYNIWVGGHQVTDDNKNDVLGTSDGDGATVTYDSDTNTITLNGATINSGRTVITSVYGIYVPGNLNLKLVGTNSIDLSSILGTTVGISTSHLGNSKLIISGESNGVLTITADNQFGIESENLIINSGTITTIKSLIRGHVSMVISGGTVISTGGAYGITGESLTVSGGTVTASGSSMALHLSEGSPNLIGMQVTASNNEDGTNATVIDKDTLTDANISTYKYLKFEPTPPAPNPVEHTVIFNANGGTVGESSRTVDHDNAIGTLPTPTRSGYRFDGWFTDANGGTQISAEEIITEYKFFFAHWTYTGSGGSGSSSGGGSSPIRPDSNTGGKKEEATVPETVAPEPPTNTGTNTEAITVQTVIAIGQNTAVITENGVQRQITMDVAPRTQNGRTMMPIRFVADVLGVDVAYDNSAKSASFIYADATVVLVSGQKTMTVNGQTVELQTAPLLVNGRVLLPLRDIQQAFAGLGLNTSIDYDSATKSVTIEKQ